MKTACRLNIASSRASSAEGGEGGDPAPGPARGCAHAPRAQTNGPGHPGLRSSTGLEERGDLVMEDKGCGVETSLENRGDTGFVASGANLELMHKGSRVRNPAHC